MAAVLAPFVLSTVLSTLYLRMHYVADVLAGVLLVPVSTLIGLKGDLWWARLHGFLARRLQAVDWRRGAVAVRAGVAALVLVWIVSLVI